MDYTTAIILSILLLVGNAFFVGSEFALISARKTQLEPRAASGSRAAKTALRAMSKVSLMMAGAQFGITVCSIGLGAVAKPAVADAVEGPLLSVGLPSGASDAIAIAISLVIVVSLHMVLGEMVPKNIAIARPEGSAIFLGPLLFAVVTILRPIIWTLNTLANLVLRLLHVKVRDEVATTFTRDEVAGLIEESARHGFLEERERDLLTGALDFVEVRVRDITLPLHDVVTVASNVTPRELQTLCVDTGYSRFPVVEDGRMVGYVHVKDLVSLPARKLDEPLRPSYIRDFPEVRDTDTLSNVLATMQRRGVHMVQVNADGRQHGVAMLEDVLERIVGDVVA
ncbi:MAG: Magnesium and cobalt efflux protein CorC [Actinomycetota bacterium]|jgi:CBS domain containing-hemolysin-like protein